MSKGFGIHGSTTDHGGTVISTQSRSSQMGNLFLRAGDGFACPKCKVWSTLIKSNDHVIFDGKAVAYVGDKFTCGATLLPKQDHVVGDSGGGSSKLSVSNFQATSQQNNNFMDDVIKKNAIVLKDLNIAPFIPLSAPKPDGLASNVYFIFSGSIINGIFEAIVLEIKKGSDFIEIQRVDKSFSGNQDFKIKWDGFVQDVYDSKFITNANGIVFRVKGINGGSAIALDEKTFNFKYFNKDWIDVNINRKTLKININLRVNLVDGGSKGLYNGQSVPVTEIKKRRVQPYSVQTKNFSQLLQLSIDGINYYWSRNQKHPTGKNIFLNGKEYEVFIKTINSKTNAMPEMKLTYITNVDPNDPMFRSSNSILSRKTAYMTGYLHFDRKTWGFYPEAVSDKSFKETIAHETGHAIVEAYGGVIDSITHHGSSEVWQVPKSGTSYPTSGEIDLMKYAEGSLTGIPNWDKNMVANKKDVTGLLFISGISKK